MRTSLEKNLPAPVGDPTTALAFYSAAKTALAEAVRVDEVLNIHDQTEAWHTYARLAKDDQLLRDAAEIRMRAERRAGELLIEMRERGERDPGGRGRLESRLATLTDLGITKHQSSHWQELAKSTTAEFERALIAASVDGPPTRASLTRELGRKEYSAQVGEIDRPPLTLPNGTFGVICVTPPFRQLPSVQITEQMHACSIGVPHKTLTSSSGSGTCTSPTHSG